MRSPYVLRPSSATFAASQTDVHLAGPQRLALERGYRADLPDIEWERPVCCNAVGPVRSCGSRTRTLPLTSHRQHHPTANASSRPFHFGRFDTLPIRVDVGGLELSSLSSGLNGSRAAPGSRPGRICAECRALDPGGSEASAFGTRGRGHTAAADSSTVSDHIILTRCRSPNESLCATSSDTVRSHVRGHEHIIEY